MDSLEDFKKRIEKVLDLFEDELRKMRANRPSTSLVEDLRVDYYGTPTPIKHLGSISINPPREINVQVWDKEAVKSVSDAIDLSDLGVSPNVDGNVVRLFLPELSQERREELLKYTKNIAEEYRIQIRNARDEINKNIESKFDNKEISEDEKFRAKEEIQEETEKANKKIEEILEKKKKEIES